MDDDDDDEDEEDKEACWASISRRACSRMERMASSEPPPPPPPPPLDEDGGRDVSAVRCGKTSKLGQNFGIFWKRLWGNGRSKLACFLDLQLTLGLLQDGLNGFIRATLWCADTSGDVA